ncbi:hypothetical protein U9M48_016716 [Paspalum notatum var. saurae]|uniref:DUF569 domain-containing protein n=1 Tax=Paspalum notatum var. saurae TaxID=547442 RepID=A0AAQ3T827_PASNO
MEFFPDRAHVRLRSCVRGGGYIDAEQDGLRVSMVRQRGLLTTVWKVHRVVRDGDDYVLLYGAAFGRYLASSPGRRRVVQCNYNSEDQDNVLWVPIRAEDGRDEVLIRHGTHRTRYLDVTGDGDDVDESTRWNWEVLPVGPRPEPPLFPPPRAVSSSPPPSPWKLESCGPWRRIVFRRGNGGYQRLRAFSFCGGSVFFLRNVLACLLDEDVDSITLCVKAGSQARLTPLVSDLPYNCLPVHIVVLNHRTAGESLAL